MDDDYFNEDDLINDYIADAADGSPPPDEYDHFDDGPSEPDEEDGFGGNAGNDADPNIVNNETDENNGNDITTNERIDQPDEAGVPKLISTSANQDSRTSWRTSNDDFDLYGFERYSGLSSWRDNKKKEDTPLHGATTMEATGWKKQTEEGNMKDGGDDGDESMDEDDLDNGRMRSKRGAGNIDIGSNARGGTGIMGAGGKSAEAQLVRFCERQEVEIHGRSWGRMAEKKIRVALQDERFVHGTKPNLVDMGSEQNEGENIDHTMPKLGEKSVAITTAEGNRIYVRRSKRGASGPSDPVGTSTSSDKTSAKHSQEGCLLGLPMTEIVRRADIIEKRAIKRKLERQSLKSSDTELVTNIETGEEHDLGNDEDDANQNMEDVDQPKQNSKADEAVQEKEAKEHRRKMQLKQRLWVDKHAPTTIFHLLSDERTNREVLRALRAWDPYVFKKDPPPRPTYSYNNYAGRNMRGNSNQGKGSYPMDRKDNFRGKREDKEDGAMDDMVNQKADIRPDETSRVILLSGPPGVGKSTLAHIVCKHAGYRPIEVNASDERSASALTERVTRAMESSTLNLGENDEFNGKPNCIILDEVDGADAKSSIAALVDIIRADIPPAAKGGSSKGKKGGRARSTYLRRPIILICNHKHAPALRPILPYAKQFDVQPPNPERLAARLRAVLAAEKMSVVAGGMLLHRLVAATGGDVRSCLYALQFASARARELAAKKQREREASGAPREGTGDLMVDISSTLMAALGDKGNGMKDMQSDVSSTVAKIFRKEKSSRYSNKRQKISSTGSANAITASKCVDLVLKAVDHFGDNSKTLDCLFMNVNRVSYVDPTLDRCSVAFEWLSGADTYRSNKSNVAMNNSAEHQSMQKFYMPSAAAAIHLLCSVETRPDLTFSTRPLADLFYQNEANTALVHRFVEGLAPRARRGVGGGSDVVVSDVIPYCLWLLSAGRGKHSLSKAVSSVDFLSAEEKLAFSAHVDTLRALGLTYVKEDGDFKYSNTAKSDIRLEPEINKLVTFDDMSGDYSLNRKNVPSALKELLAHGATVAALRERESESKKAQDEIDKATPKEKDKKLGPTETKSAENTITALKENQPKRIGSNSQVAKNFLGLRAAKAKEHKTARRAARVGFDRSAKVKLSNTGSGVEMSKVIRFKYQKGFTQAVRAPCQLEDLL